jgi:hypothetical protein
MSKQPDGRPDATERANLIQRLISMGVTPGAAHDLISSDRSRKENAEKIAIYIRNLKKDN